MFRRLSIIISFLISMGVILSVVGIFAFNNMTWVSYRKSFEEHKMEQYVNYSNTIIAELNNGISANAYWTEALEHLKKADDNWLAENATTYITDMGMFNMDYILIADESLSFIQESGGTYKDELLSMPYIKDALQNDVTTTFFTPLGDTYAIVMATPFMDNNYENPFGIYVAAAIYDSKRSDKLHELMGDELVGYRIYLNATGLDYYQFDKEKRTVNSWMTANVLHSDYQIKFDYDLTDMQASFQKQRNYTVCSIVIASVLATSFILAFLWLIINRIKQITQKVVDISEGDYDSTVNIDYNKNLFEMYALASAVNKMSTDMKKNLEVIDKNYLDMVEVIITAVEINDSYTSRHNVEVGKYARIIAKKIKYENMEDIVLAAKLHDIGKISVPSHILNKPGKLTQEEYEIVKNHSVEGYKIIENIDYFSHIKYGVKYHHEHWDGTGYPEGLRENEIPLIAQIISIADVYDALTSNRSYRKGMSHNEAVKIIISESGKLFNPLLVSAFIGSVDEFECYYESIRNER